MISQFYSRFFLFRGILFDLVIGAAVVVIEIICSIVTWQMAFLEKRISNIEGIVGSIASLVCVALNISLLVNGDPMSVFMVLATLFVMVNIAMTERPISERRAQERIRKVGPLL